MKLYVVVSVIQHRKEGTISPASYSVLAESEARAIGEFVLWVAKTRPDWEIRGTPGAHRIPDESVRLAALHLQDLKEANDANEKRYNEALQ